MAFDPNKRDHTKKVEQAIQASSNKNSAHTQSKVKLNIPKKKPKEKKERYSFSLLPSVRKNIEKLAEENNYSSSSELLNELFKEQ